MHRSTEVSRGEQRGRRRVAARAVALFAALFVTIFVGPSVAHASPTRCPLQDRLAVAAKWLEEGKHKAALKDLEKYVRDFPDDAQGWILLGRCLHASQRFGDALDALRRASERPKSMPTAAYHAARACDRLEKIDEAFVWLDRALETGYEDWNTLRSDKDLERCREDERFHHRVPFSSDPKKPFVEAQVAILFDLHGELQKGRFGWSAADIGDVDGDQRRDFAIGAPYHTDTAKHGGKVYVYSGRNGRELVNVSASDDELMGWALGAAGDVNGDGKLDFWVAAPGQNEHPGSLYVISGVDGGQLKRLPGQGTNDRFTEAVCPLGDLDGDGIVEVCVAAPGNDAAGEDCGRVYVVSLVDGSVHATFEGPAPLVRLGGGGVAAWKKGDELRIAASAPKAGADRKGAVYVWSSLEKSEPLVLEGDASARSRGGRIGFVPDLDGDGEPDLVASDELEDTPSLAAALLWSWSSKTDAVLFKLSAPLSGDGFGRSFAPLGDLDGDGRSDFAVGAWRSRRGGPLAGAVTIHAGGAAPGAVIGRVTGGLARTGFGFCVAPLSDLDGDSIPELIVTAPHDASRGNEAGRAFVLSGASLRLKIDTKIDTKSDKK
jgi:hypothetical protein